MAKYRRSKSEGKIAHKKTTIDGIVFDSRMESEFYLFLKDLKKKKKIKDFDMQPEFVLQPKHFVYEGQLISFDDEIKYKEYDKLRQKYNKANPDKKIAIVNAIKYKSDFTIYLNDGTTEIIDVKGIKTADFKIKEKMFAFRYPNLRLTCVTWDGSSNAWLTYDEYQAAKKARKKLKESKPNTIKKTKKRK